MESSSNVSALCHRLDFGPFSLLPSQRMLLRDQVPVPLGARAFDILLALTARPGELLSKAELIAQAWPHTFVDAASLRVHMVALRKALGDSNAQLIRTDPGRGYRFTATVLRVDHSPRPSVGTSPAASLPNTTTRLIGRTQFIERLATQLPRRRFITIVGPGGIGKTSIATACAHTLARSYRDGVAFLDLSKVDEPESIGAALAEVLGVAGGAEPRREAIEYLRNRDMLLVVDNCEHVIGAAAELTEAIYAAATGVHILATSREALRAFGECVAVVPPLASPPEATKDISAADALSYPAVELFVERASAVRFGYWLSDADAPVVAQICRRLDGVALAIELAAAQLDTFGVQWLATHLNESLWQQSRARRTAVPRHRTMAAVFDWSYRLLSESERMTLQRVAACSGPFTLADAIGMAASDGIGDLEVVGAVTGLVAKSLATLDADGSMARYRLGEMTRAYVCNGFAGGDCAGASYV